VLGGDEQFTSKTALGGTAPQRLFGRYAKGIRIVVFLGHVREDQVARDGVETSGSARYSLTA